MYDNIRIYKPLAARVGPLFDIFRVGCLGGAGATESGKCEVAYFMCAKCVRALLQVQIVRRRNSGLFN